MQYPKLVPELSCSDIERSLKFYIGVLGFEVLYARPEERFAYVQREGAELMLDQVGESSWTTAELAHPYGRGMNLQIEVTDVDALYATVQLAGSPIYLPIEEKWYRREETLVGNRQFIVQDPDGYLLRFAEDLGERPV
jgi:catechol 2,3-dioxygenase-like lactoylglutathione lyase family enzyme